LCKRDRIQVLDTGARCQIGDFVRIPAEGAARLMQQLDEGNAVSEPQDDEISAVPPSSAEP